MEKLEKGRQSKENISRAVFKRMFCVLVQTSGGKDLLEKRRKIRHAGQSSAQTISPAQGGGIKSPQRESKEGRKASLIRTAWGKERGSQSP